MVGKTKWKPLELPLPWKIMIQNQYCIPGEITEIRVEFPTMFRVTLLEHPFREGVRRQSINASGTGNQ